MVMEFVKNNSEMEYDLYRNEIKKDDKIDDRIQQNNDRRHPVSWLFDNDFPLRIT